MTDMADMMQDDPDAHLIEDLGNALMGIEDLIEQDGEVTLSITVSALPGIPEHAPVRYMMDATVGAYEPGKDSYETRTINDTLLDALVTVLGDLCVQITGYSGPHGR